MSLGVKVTFSRHFRDNHNIMIYVTYVIAGAFIALAFAMLYVFYRSSHVGMFIMGLAYGCSGLIAILLGEWWPLVAGFALVWVLKLLGLEPRGEPPGEEGGSTKKAGE
jgi:hypothetical protein